MTFATMNLNPDYMGQYLAIVDAIEAAGDMTINELVRAKVIARGRVTLSYRVKELTDAGVLGKIADRPVRYEVINRFHLGRSYQRTPLELLPQETPEGHIPPEDLMAQIGALIGNYVDDVAEGWWGVHRSEIEERDAKIAELETKLEQARKLFQ